MTGVNAIEKIYSSIVIMSSTFFYAVLFGNLASMVDDLTPKFQKEFENKYRNVLEYAKNTNLDSFINKIHVRTHLSKIDLIAILQLHLAKQ